MAKTLRYRAASRYTYAQALLALTELAREHTGPPFEFGPLALDALEQQGLQVTGSSLKAVTDSLREIPGLVEFPA